MKKLKPLVESILFASNLLLLFLLIFADKVIEPAWVQVVGRMHPLLLHFPIVVLLMAVLWEWLPLRRDPAQSRLYRQVDAALLLTGSLTASITAIMGLLLSLQGGYEGAAVQWHKWTGVAIAFLSYAYYTYKHSRYTLPAVNKITGVIIAGCLIIAGHLGANITHGNDFLMQPLAKKPVSVPIDQAVVFEHLIKPVLETKCMSCHNHRKAKGGLVMETKALLLKGGEDGKLFVAGHPELSMLIKRIHLPEDAKEHMPPSGKPQLSEEEAELLYWWIHSGAPFEQKVTALPAKDSLRILAAHFLQPPAAEAAETFDFAAADEKKVKALNTNYRVITPLAEESPALAVNFYNKNAYTAASLEELKDVREQIVDLNLAKMPVKDADLKIIAQFENLRSLNLNFTDITGAGLKALTGLKHLRQLALSGTGVEADAVAQLGQMPALQDVYIWSTGLKDEDIAGLQSRFKKIHFEAGYEDTAHTVLALSPPLLETPPGIFSDSLLVQMKHPIAGVKIRYTLDGKEPDSLHSPLYKEPFKVGRNIRLKARAYKTGWFGSEVAEASYFRAAVSADSIILVTLPDAKYHGRGARTLGDRELGDAGFGNGKWLGYRKENMEVMLVFRQPVSLHSAGLSFLKNIPGYIFPPARLEVWGGKDPDHMKFLGKVNPPRVHKDDPSGPVVIQCDLPSVSVNCLRIVAKPLPHLPAWHRGKGEPAWIMASEVLLN